MARATSELLTSLRTEEALSEKSVIAVVIPCYRERDHILEVLGTIPGFVAKIICVDDGCPDKTGELITADNTDARVEVIQNDINQGVGGATIRGYKAALRSGATIIVKIDGDGQMDASMIETLIEPVKNGSADYAKGNRFFDLEKLQSMPRMRLFGNAILSFVSKFSTGYWQTFDPTNGFTAIHRDVLALLPLDKIDKGYFFESDMLFRLNTLGGVVMDVPMPARYGEETSHLSVRKVLATFLYKHAANFFKRIFYNYFLRGFSVASIQWVAGPMLVLLGLVFGLNEWVGSAQAGVTATAGTVMLAALPTIVGIQFVLSAIDHDIRNVPSFALHRLLRPRVDSKSQ
ncbi:MAG: glycosyltransferase family 2 protein [Gammaproteobacteria bacterium]